MVDGAGEDALAGCGDDVAVIGEAEAFGGAGDEGFDCGRLAAAEGVEFCEFDDPRAHDLDGGVFGPHSWEFVGEPVAAEGG